MYVFSLLSGLEHNKTRGDYFDKFSENAAQRLLSKPTEHSWTFLVIKFVSQKDTIIFIPTRGGGVWVGGIQEV